MIEIEAVVGGILADDDDFLHAVGHELLGFGDEFVDGTRAVGTADEGDGAVGTGAVAAFGNLEVGVVRRSGEVAMGVGEAEEFGTMPFVDFGHLVLQLLHVALDEASADDETGAVVAAFFGGDLVEDGVDALLLGIADETAGVDDDGVAVVALAVEEDSVAFGGETAGEFFAIDGVLGTPKGDDVDFQLTDG